MFTDSDFGNGKPALARGVVGLIGLVLLAFSAITTASFFYSYAGGIFSFLTPALSPYLSAVVGVIVFEGMSVAWRWFRQHDADTERQLSLAGVGSWLALCCGILCTIVYMSLETSLLSGVIDETTRVVLNITGALLLIIGVSGNFAIMHFYSDSSSATLAAGNQAATRALTAAAHHAIQQETTKATMQATIDQVRENLPNRARRQGVVNSQQFMSEYFTVGNGDNGRVRFVDIDDGSNGVNPTRRQ